MASQQRPGTTIFEHVARWLPSDVETVYATNVGLEGLVDRMPESVPTSYAALAASAIEGLRRAGVPTDVLGTFKATEGLYAGRHFRTLRPAGGLGLAGALEACSFLRSSQSAVDKLLRLLGDDGPQGRREGQRYRLVPSLVSPNPLLFSALEPGLLMVCSDRSFGDEILALKATSAKRPRLQISDIIRAQVETSAMIWGLRLFRHGTTDPTSVLSPALGILPEYRDSGAVAMTFALETSSRAKVIYLTKSEGRLEGYERTWDVKATVASQSGYRVVTIIFDPSQDATGQMRVRVMLMLLGMLVVV